MEDARHRPDTRDAAAIERAIVTAVRSFIGTPFQHKGRVPGSDGAMDCFAVLTLTAQLVGLAHKDFLDYDRDVDGSQIEERLARYCDRVCGNPTDAELRRLRPGNILLFWIEDPQNPQHFSILTYVDPPGGRGITKFVHARERMDSDVSKVQEIALDRFWRDRIVSVWRYKWHPSA